MRRNPSLAAVILVGCLTRGVLLPITHGQDFVVWDRAAAATLRGVNVYANHPSYPGGPYAYFPLFLFIELPLRWLAAHSGVSFTVLGKLPIVAGDLLSAVMIAVRLRQQGHRDATVAVGTALFFLNPLVLYNGAFYGRFDTVCLGLLLLALWRKPQERPAGWRSSLTYALAVAAKTFPVVLLPGLIRSRWLTARRAAAALVAVLGALSLPYLLTSPRAYITDVVLYDAKKLPSGLTWQRALLPALSSGQARWLSYLVLGLFALALFLVTAQKVDTYCLAAIILFLLSSKVVLEQYLLWPMPWLIMRTVDDRSASAAAILVLLTAIGMLANPYIHPLGQQSLVLAMIVAAALASYVVWLLHEERRKLATTTVG